MEFYYEFVRLKVSSINCKYCKTNLRIIEGWKSKQKVDPIFKKFQILNINQIFHFEIAKFMYFFWSNDLLQTFNKYFYYVSEITTRSSRKTGKNDLYLSWYKINQSQKSIKFLGVKIWNNIPQNIRTLTINKFKERIKSIYCKPNKIINFITQIEKSSPFVLIYVPSVFIIFHSLNNIK